MQHDNTELRQQVDHLLKWMNPLVEFQAFRCTIDVPRVHVPRNDIGSNDSGILEQPADGLSRRVVVLHAEKPAADAILRHRSRISQYAEKPCSSPAVHRRNIRGPFSAPPEFVNELIDWSDVRIEAMLPLFLPERGVSHATRNKASVSELIRRPNIWIRRQSQSAKESYTSGLSMLASFGQGVASHDAADAMSDDTLNKTTNRKTKVRMLPILIPRIQWPYYRAFGEVESSTEGPG